MVYVFLRNLQHLSSLRSHLQPSRVERKWINQPWAWDPPTGCTWAQTAWAYPRHTPSPGKGSDPTQPWSCRYTVHGREQNVRSQSLLEFQSIILQCAMTESKLNWNKVGVKLFCILYLITRLIFLVKILIFDSAFFDLIRKFVWLNKNSVTVPEIWGALPLVGFVYLFSLSFSLLIFVKLTKCFQSTMVITMTEEWGVNVFLISDWLMGAFFSQWNHLFAGSGVTWYEGWLNANCMALYCVCVCLHAVPLCMCVHLHSSFVSCVQLNSGLGLPAASNLCGVWVQVLTN